MRVDELMRSLLRRPLALLVIVAIAAAGAFAGYSRAASTYQSSATVLIVPPTASDGTVDNPFTRLDFSTSQVALIVATQLDSDAVRDQVVAVGGSGQYDTDTLSGDNSATAQLTPQVRINATSATAEGASAAVDVLIDQAGAQLAAVQSASNVPTAAQTEIVVSSPPTTPALVGNPQVRAAGVLGIAGGFLALLALVAVLPFLDRRTRRKAAVAPAEDAAPELRFPTAVSPAGPPAQTTRTEATTDDEAAPTTSATPDRTPSLRRQETLRQMVRDEYQRSGSNVPWTRREQRAAYLRAEERLAEKERRRRDPGDDNVSRLDEFVSYRDHG